jgi:phosphoglycolate phosphatase
MKTILILDFDGTVHDSMAVYEPSFRRAMKELEQAGWMEQRDYSTEEIRHWIGFNPQEMWRAFRPDLSKAQRAYGSSLIGKYMEEAVEKGAGRLYPQAGHVLEGLREEYELYFLSNCKRAYMEANRRQFQLDRYFDAFYCSQDFGFIPKEEIFRRIREPQRNYVAVGDREADLRLAKENGLPFVGCLYGFGGEGELDGADVMIEDIAKLPLSLEQIKERSSQELS